VGEKPPVVGRFDQNDESPNLIKWAYYRKVMGF
jgi:hypothetical protein